MSTNDKSHKTFAVFERISYCDFCMRIFTSFMWRKIEPKIGDQNTNIMYVQAPPKKETALKIKRPPTQGNIK